MSHYFENDKNLKSEQKKNFVQLNNQDFSFITDHGVFSKKGLDFGTRTLLETIAKEEISGKILDFGCGYGPIGIILAKTTNAHVTMVDINDRSLELAYKNAALNQVDVQIKASNFYENVTEMYDYIVSNPPIRVGKDALYKILFEAKLHLKKGGQLWIVIHKDQGAKSTAKDLEKAYHVQIITKNKGFYIICATNN